MFTGAVLVTIAISNPADLGGLAGGYGLMLMGSALFLLAGLGLRARVLLRAANPPAVAATVPAASRS